MTPTKIEELIKARTAELQSVINFHQSERNAFLQASSQRQLKVTHLEGCIAELRGLLALEESEIIVAEPVVPEPEQVQSPQT